MQLASIDAGLLVQVVWTSLLAGVGVTTIFSLLVYAGARAGEARRDGDSTSAAVFGGIAMLMFLVFIGAVGLGVTIMLQKG